MKKIQINKNQGTGGSSIRLYICLLEQSFGFDKTCVNFDKTIKICSLFFFFFFFLWQIHWQILKEKKTPLARPKHQPGQRSLKLTSKNTRYHHFFKALLTSLLLAVLINLCYIHNGLCTCSRSPYSELVMLCRGCGP